MKVFNQANLEITRAAAKESGRYAIDGVHITPDGTEATNGRLAVRVSSVELDTDGAHARPLKDVAAATAFTPFLLNGVDAERLLATLPKATAKVCWLEKGESQDSPPRVAMRLPGGTLTHACELSDAIFPKMSLVYPKPEQEFCSVCLSPRSLGLLVRLCEKFQKVTCSSEQGMRLTITTRGQVKLEAEAYGLQRFDALLMPCNDPKHEEDKGYDMEAHAVTWLRERGYTVVKKAKAPKEVATAAK